MRNTIFYKLLFSFLCLAATGSVIHAQFEEGRSTVTVAPIIGNTIITGANSTVSYSNTGENSRRIKNIISFRYDEDTTVYFASGFTATVNFTLETQVTVGSPVVVSPTKTLVISYDKTANAKYNVRGYIVLPSEYEVVKVVVSSISITGNSGWDPKPLLKLENEIRILRYFTLSNNPTYLSPAFNAKVTYPDALGISWSWNPATYNNISQVEWAWMETEMRGYYVEDGNFNLENLFLNNSTRVDLEFTQNGYKIPLLYAGAGKLFYRVRAAYRKNDGTILAGPWSVPDSFAYTGHEPNLNWQSATSFVENGKFKAAAQYFDGSLRVRQTVTKDNSTNNTIVGETIYDLQGRANVQIMPTPTIDTVIKFFNDFNRFQGQTSINDDPTRFFDLTPMALQCSNAPRLDSNYGNAKYFSSNNPWMATESKSAFIPNAFGFAFTETRFMDDVTQRIRSQGGLGQAHQVGSGREMKYYYGKPSQPELDALFGTEAGDASHYSKNMVKDANGQVSVTYVDMHGRTVATALAGNATPGIDSLLANPADYPLATNVLTNQLLTPATNIIRGNSVESVTTLLVPATAQYDFTYKLDPALLSQINCNNQQVCFDCKYDLEISIKSEDCGDTTPIIRRYSNLQIVPANEACGISMGFVGTGVSTATKQIDFSQILATGSWIVRKTLTINDSMFNIRKDSALKAFLCKSQQSIYDSVYAVLYATSGCGATGTTQSCDSCLANLGSYNVYKAKYLLSIGSPAVYSEDEIHAQYSQDSLACVQACSLSPQLSTVLSMRNQMLTDMIPFTGQYALENIVNSSGTPDPNRLEGKYNIFTTSYYYNGTTYSKPAYYQNPVNGVGVPSSYFTEDNDIDITIHPPGNPGFLASINKTDFTQLFQSSWAKSLIYYHPEYTKLQYAEGSLKTSFDWLDKVLACNSYDAAVSLGATNPMSNDPYFLNNFVPQDVTDMQRYLTNYIGAQSSNPSIWRLANGIILCATVPENQRMGCINGKNNAGIDAGATTPELRNRIWEQFKTMYLSYRNEMVMKYIDSRPGVLSQTDMTTLQNEGKQLVFVTMQGAAAQNGWSSWWNNVTSGDTTGTGVYTGTNTNNIDNCVAQRPFWRARLLQCESLVQLLNNETSGDSTTVNTIINSILDQMVLVCNNSRDAQHPWGASNVRPGYAGSPQNFEQVINTVLNSYSMYTPPNFFCNPYTIDFPKPYGKNPPVTVNNSNKIDSCACNQFHKLKLEAQAASYDTLSFTSMNLFLQTNYNDSVSAILWEGLQRCNQLYADSCWYTYGPSDVCNSRIGGEQGKENTSLRPPLCPFGDPLITEAVYVTTGFVKNVRVYYSCVSPVTACEIFVYDQYNNLVQTRSVTCGTNLSVLFSLPACQFYNFVLVNYTASCGTYYSAAMPLYPLPSCNATCPKPVINSTSINLPPPTSTTQNVTVNYTIPSGAFNCKLKVYEYSCNNVYPVDSFPINCAGSSVNFNLWACVKYRFVISCNISAINSNCDSIAISDTARMDSCWRSTCQKVYTPVPLSDFTVIPPFLDCGYQKPCITCGRLDSLTTEFRQIYPAFSGVPYLDSASTDDQAKQNSLWARFLNYRTGFSKNAIDYMVAYNNCHTMMPPPSLAICSFTKPMNDPTDMYPPDTMPCKNVQTQAQFIAYFLYEKNKDSLIAKFDSLYTAKCLDAKYTEEFYAKYKPREFHYTLYYYDQAGNLVKTMPPAAVKPNYDATYLANVKNARSAGTDLPNPLNNILLCTQFRYNTLNQVVTEKSPDKGTSKSWYDRLGRLAVSQNAKQLVTGVYSYTLYDAMGRVIEGGEKPQNAAMTQAICQDTTSLKNWLVGGGVKRQITRTVYDEAYTPLNIVVNGSSGLWQKNLRNRASYMYVKNADDQADIWDAASFYSYDISGNVDTLLQDYKTSMGAVPCTNDPGQSGNRFKKIVYNYDLISGKVNEVTYQAGQADQFYHRYVYDAANKLLEAWISKDKIYWELDVRYDYYRHGPLSRAVLGQNKVQGIDYVYTIQGWLKGMNSTDFQSGPNPISYDAGQDAVNIAGNANRYIGKDAFGFSLYYFNNDYKPINTGSAPFVSVPQLLPADPVSGVVTGTDLFNGNIRAMAVSIPQLGAAKLYGYRYDQLNRFVRMDAFDGTYMAGNSATLTRTTDYHEEVSYDPNGNIRTYLRNGTTQAGNQLAMDNLTYQYEKTAGGELASNKLRYVHDQVSATNYLTEDIDSQTPLNLGQVLTDNSLSQLADNFRYDEIGNLVKNVKDSIDNIEWTVLGKIKTITKISGTIINYTYDPAGNRISKVVSAGSINKATYYVRDASGNVMSIYTREFSSMVTIMALSQTELHLYGSGRLGVYNVNVDVQNCAATASEVTYFKRGNKSFELVNHLGNVLVTVSDKKIAVSANLTTVDYYMAEVVTANDYYPFGMIQPGRKYQAATDPKYRYSINGQEKEIDINENITTAVYWEYDGRIGRRWNVDPVFRESQSAYACYSGNPIWMVDPLGNSDSTYTTPDNGTLTLPEQAVIKSKYLTNTNYFLTGTSIQLSPVVGAVREFVYNGEVYSARYNDAGQFTRYQSDVDNSHYLSYDDNNLPSWEVGGQSGFQAFAYGALAMPATKVNPWVLGGTLVLAGIAWLASDDEDLLDDVDMTRPIAIPLPPSSIPRVITPPPPLVLYRGVHVGHPDYQNALLGMAIPRGGNATPEDHAGGNNNSIYTSWTMFRVVADYHANKRGPGGVVLSKVFLPGQYIPNFTFFPGEGEYLVPGPVSGAAVLKPLGPGSPNGY
jgi:YD repeat-containing protein